MTARIMTVPTAAIDDDQPRKFGCWFTPNLQVAAWRIRPGQEMVTHCHPDADALVVVLEGEGDLLLYEDSEPDPSGCYRSEPDAVVVPPPPADSGTPTRAPIVGGTMVIVGAGTYFGIANTGGTQMVVVVATGPDSATSIYTVRAKAPIPA